MTFLDDTLQQDKNYSIHNENFIYYIQVKKVDTLKDEHGIPWPPSFILYQLPKLASSFLHKTTANLFYICQIYSNKFSPILTIQATKRPVSFFPAHKTKSSKANWVIAKKTHPTLQQHKLESGKCNNKTTFILKTTRQDSLRAWQTTRWINKH